MDANNVDIERSWKKLLEKEFEKPYFYRIVDFLKKEKRSGKVIYPPGSLVFNAFNITPVDKVKVVVLGQDPYHGPQQAMGLSFSVPKHIRIPPSLKNIFKEINNDLDIDTPDHGDLTRWAEQGVFLLNAILTVEHKRAASHKKIGWHHFTDAVIENLSEYRENLVFMLWGNFAKSKKDLIDADKHLILTSPHPSPLARGGFFNNHHFSRCNNYLRNYGKGVIDWQL